SKVPSRRLTRALRWRATHSATQSFYFDRRGLLKRHDYEVDVAGGGPAAHYVSELQKVSVIKAPTKRMVSGRQPDGKPLPNPLLVSIDLNDAEFSQRARMRVAPAFRHRPWSYSRLPLRWYLRQQTKVVVKKHSIS